MIEVNGRKFIVACDDFGISERANRNILELVKLGKIDRVAVMMGTNISPEEVQLLLASGVKLDIHLHLDNGQICSCHEKEIGGTISRSASFLGSYLSGERRSEKVEKKWRNQIEEFKKLFGKNPDGINSHEHLHFFPPYFRIASRLGRELSIPYFRFGKKGIGMKNPVCWVINILRLINKGVSNRYALPSSDYMVSFDWVSNFSDLYKEFPSNTSIELIFHPEREEEFRALSNM